MDFKKLARQVYPEYNGRKIRLVTTGKVSFYDTNWSGGTRNQFRSYKLENGKLADLPVPAPWMNQVEGKTVEIPEGFIVVEHSIFCGKDMGLRVYISNAECGTKLLTEAI